MELVYQALAEDLQKASISDTTAIDGNSEGRIDKYFDSIHQVMSIRLQTRCGGLLEIHIREATDNSWKSGSLSYIHCTVSDYLQSLEIWKEVLSYASPVT